MEKRRPSFKGLQPLFQIATSVTKKACTKHEGFLASLLLDWPLIVGAELAAKTQPKKVQFPRGQNEKGTVTLAVSSGAESMVIYHMTPILLNKINTFFGYKAFHTIKLVQTKDGHRLQTPTASDTKVTLSKNEETHISGLIANLPDGPLKDALQDLGAELYLKDKTHGR